MKGRVIALDHIGGRKAAAMLEDGVLVDLLVDPAPGPNQPPAPGTIFRAICDRPMKGQGGMMMRLPDRASAYLRKGKGLAAGQALLVQVSGRAEAGKAVPVSTRILLKSRYAIVTPGAPGINVSRQIRDEEERARLLEIAHAVMEGEAGLIIRSAAQDVDGADVADDIAAMRDLAAQVAAEAAGTTAQMLVEGADVHMLAWRDWPRPDLFTEAPGCFGKHGLDETITAILAPKQPLKGGGFAFIEPTRAFVAVDVNTGGDTSQAAGLKANIALARDLPRLLRCRGLGGQIIIDFAPMAKKDRPQLEQILRAALRRDPIETALAGWTALGNYELQRKRERIPVNGADLFP